MTGSHTLISMLGLALALGVIISMPSGGQSIGVCYGMVGDNLPSPIAVVSLYKSYNIKAMRLYSPSPLAFQALKHTGIEVILDVPREDLPKLATDPSAAAHWVRDNVLNYWPDVKFKCITVGNEVIPGPYAHHVLPAMQKLHVALLAAGIRNQVKLSTAVSSGVLSTSYPPSQGAFSPEAMATMKPIVRYLIAAQSPLLANVYPYISYASNPARIDLRYALFTSTGIVVRDGQYNYQNLFDAMVDALYSALERIGGRHLEVVVSETGWPTAGGAEATRENAQTYNTNLIRHVEQGTPKRAGRLETYIFAMFDEDKKQPPGVENNWGLFYPNKAAKYPLSLNKQ